MTKSRRLPFQVFFTLTMIAVSQCTQAFENLSTHPYFEFALEAGGDKLASEPGGFTGIASTHAGGGIYVAVGALLNLQTENSNGDFLASIGYLDSDGDEANFSATHVDLIYFFKNARSPHRFGLGTTIHINPKLQLDPHPVDGCIIFCFNSSFPEGTTEFDNAIGVTFRYEYNFLSDSIAGNGLTIGVRYTAIEYKSNVDNVDASGIGLYLNIF